MVKRGPKLHVCEGPVATTVTFKRVGHFWVNHRAHDDRGVLRGDVLYGCTDLGKLAQRQIQSRGNVDQNAARSTEVDVVKQRAVDGPLGRFSMARLSPDAVPVPIMAAPISDITVRTSAKSTFTKPGLMIRSAIPCTAPSNTSLASLKRVQQRRLGSQYLQQLLVREW